jgi:Leucine-rich repeat (LRR) protein
MVYLADMKGLKYLSLDECLFVSDEGIANLKGMKNLVELHLWSTSVRSAGLDVIAGLTSLETLNLDKVEVTDDDLAKLKALKNLEWLNLSSTLISDAGLAHLQELPQLKTLIVEFCTDVSPAAIEALQKANPDLEITY